MRRAILLGLLFLVGVVTTASAQPYGGGGAVRRRAVTWDSNGWTMLGERTVNGRVDRDRIDVGRYEGKFSKLMVVVQDSDLEMLEFKINFADRTTYDPRLAFYFRENDSTRAIDLPPGESVIKWIDLKYRNVGRWGDARVQVWGFRVNAAPTYVRPAPYIWDTNGWQLLGERTVNGRTDRDTITVGRYEGRFDKLNVVVLNDDMELLEFKITFGDRTQYDPRLAFYFRENSRSRIFDLPGNERIINRIDLKYRNVGVSGPGAKVQVWGHTMPRPAPYTWDTNGWQMLGERVVNGRVDRDTITVGRYEGRFDKLNVVVLDDDMELLEFKITFGDRTQYDPRLAFYFRENSRSRSFDLPGNERIINRIDLRYRNVGRNGPGARVQVWGHTWVAPRPAAYTWDTNGWQMLGERVVNGRVDRDTIAVGRYEGRFQKLNVVVLDDDMELLEFKITFADRTTYDPRLAFYFRENSRSRFVELPPGEHVINRIDLRYKNVGRNGPGARVQVWGQHAAAPARPAFSWDNRGWRMLGEQQVNGRVDRDRINIDYGEGKFTQLMIVVLDSDIELLEFDVQFNRGDAWHPSIRQVFREQSRTRAIDLPGDRSRRIKWIDLKYKNLPGGGPGRVQIWGR